MLSSTYISPTYVQVNQSYNAVFNYCNRSGMEMTTEQQAVSYVLATGNDFFLLLLIVSGFTEGEGSME